MWWKYVSEMIKFKKGRERIRREKILLNEIEKEEGGIDTILMMRYNF